MSRRRINVSLPFPVRGLETVGRWTLPFSSSLEKLGKSIEVRICTESEADLLVLSGTRNASPADEVVRVESNGNDSEHTIYDYLAICAVTYRLL